MYKTIATDVAKLSALLEQCEEDSVQYTELESRRKELLVTAYSTLTAADRVFLARQQGRPLPQDYIAALITDFCELHGDRRCADDASIIGGIGRFCGIPVTVVATRKGKELEESLACRFGMPSPEGYRKAERLILQAEKFSRPIITFVDTPGAYPGLEAEARGQGEAIASLLSVLSGVHVPVISVITGEGGSGGALALAVCDTLIMLENSVFSILSPEGFSAILWKDASRADEAAELMGLTASDLQRMGVCDIVIPEPMGGAQLSPQEIYPRVSKAIHTELTRLKRLSARTLKSSRYKKLRAFGSYEEE